MNTDLLIHMIQECVKNGQVPRTIILTKEDADMLGVPSWVTDMYGLKVVIAANMGESKVVPYFFNTVYMKTKPDEKKLAEYQEYVIRKTIEEIKQ